MDCKISGDRSKAELADLKGGKAYQIVVRTNEGRFTIKLATETSPCATASMAGLAQKGFFDGLTFHRIVPGEDIEGGDPHGDGTGGPGYSTVDAVPADAKYTKGVVAMFRTRQGPGTAGSQFFIVTADDLGIQPPENAILGKVVQGLDVVEKIGRLGTEGCSTCLPTERVEIEAMWLMSG